ncbi:MAG: DUF4115 domain-containing protein, partial [Anaerolineaceae bacterium]|nr:DUF4115 domain-containing protein [Anaerolineaceae bacterium]
STREPPSATPQVPPASTPRVKPPQTSEALSAAKPLPSQEIFQQLGSTLRNRRDALELRLQDIEHHLHVRSDYLQALEFGRIDLLPSPVHGRGMLSNYASFLDLDVDTILLKFADGLQAQRDERLALEPPRQMISRLRSRHLSTLRQFLTADLLVGAAALIFLLVFAVWSTAQVITIRLDQPSDIDYNIAAPYQTSTAALELGEPAPSLPPPSETAQENADTQPPQSLQTGYPEQPQNKTVEPPPPANNAPLQIFILARQRVWIRVTTDNRVVFEGRVTPGTAHPFSANQKIELLTGNAAALQVTFNQQNLGILGASGEVVSLVFTASGVVTPTPRFSPTPTPTLTPTYTPAPTQTQPPTPTVPTPTITPHIP